MLLAGAGIVVLAVRVWLLSRYSGAVPYWDAWPAESTHLYNGWVQGEFRWANLWNWHNEHRIFFTRVLDMLLFIGNQAQWDVRVQTLASSLLMTTMVVIAIAWVIRHVAAPRACVLAMAIVLIAVLPNGWANTWHGFQSCFYFVVLFAILAMALLARSRPGLPAGLLVAVVSLASVFSLAAGVLLCVAASAMALLRCWLARGRPWMSWFWFLLPLLGVTVWALFDARKGEVHPATLVELVTALSIMMSWPFSSPIGVLQWLPVGVGLVAILRRREASPADLVFGGLALWVFLINFAAAWSRAYNFVDVQSRYTDLLAAGFVAQLHFMMRLVDLVGARSASIVATRVFVALVVVLATGRLGWAAREEFWKWPANDATAEIGALHTRAYLDGDESALLDRSYGFIPFPEPQPLMALLDHPVARSYLPLSLASVVDPVRQRARLCAWVPDSAEILPHDGRLTCTGAGIDDLSEGAISVGPLSAVSFAIWSMIGRQLHVPFDAIDRPGEPAVTSHCALDTINGSGLSGQRVAVTYASTIRIAGWAGPQLDGVPPRVEVVLVGTNGQVFAAAGDAGKARSEVAEWLGRPDYALSGFDQMFDGAVIPPGEYAVEFSTTKETRCMTGVTLVVERPSDTRLRY